ncbi:MAG: hypothetical protein QF466_08975 [Desulfobacterales bacterium]|jgi:glutamine synthetase|nr:hypothetical protein [Desulfobacter sp.]MDP6395563.1 hypothetical protein [Desulfobacterales bacterium]MDP6682219.1 hypothetical protein [Desulfobacterales bacterium]MDP6807082.1 hypothetical protein [Desulfobacterales bacterium]|tara:strand:+ start:28987 stop:29292 length:306 start_codon:yes stop_codon:yes gene_type:complete
MGVYATKGESREEIRARLKEAGVEYLWAQFVDMNGVAKVNQVPFAVFDDIIDEGAGFAGGAVWGLNQGPHSHDLMPRGPILKHFANCRGSPTRLWSTPIFL